MDDSISRQAAIDALDGEVKIKGIINAIAVRNYITSVKRKLEALPAAEFTCDGCKYNVGGMLYQPCTECARSAVDNWTAEDEE